MNVLATIRDWAYRVYLDFLEKAVGQRGALLTSAESRRNPEN